MKKLVIFDFDGTIADTSEGIFNSIEYAREKMGLKELTKEQMRSHIGPPMEESYAKNFALSGERLKQAIAYHKEYAMRSGFLEIKLYDGIREMLSYLKERGAVCAIATLKAQETAEKIIKAFGLDRWVDRTEGVQKTPRKKSEMLLSLLREYSLDRGDAVLVGDSMFDLVSAKEARMDFYAVVYGFGFESKEDALKAGADRAFGSAFELLDGFRREK